MTKEETVKPNKFKINNLGGFKEVVLCENIIETHRDYVNECKNLVK